MPQFKPRPLRVPTSIPVLIEQSGQRFEAVAVNLGHGGLFVDASSSLPYGEHVDVIVQLPGLAAPSRLASVVRWTSGRGFGLQFQQLGARETHAIGSLVAQYRKAEAAARAHQPANPPSQPP